MALSSSISLAETSDNSHGLVCEREMYKVSQDYDVPLGVLYAVGMTETGSKGKLHPYALNSEGKTIFTPSAELAYTAFLHERKMGKKLIDLGCMQINHYYHGKEFSSVQEMLIPQKNIIYAAKFLKKLYHKEGNWTMAVARYHAGPHNNPAQKRYICAVIRNLVATGFGVWTTGAQSFCRSKK